MPRLFIAVTLSPELIERCMGVARELKKAGHSRVLWTPPQNCHLTLKFLGSVPASRIPELRDAIEQVASRHEPFGAALGAASGFPEQGELRTLWLSVTDREGKLAALAQALEVRLACLGFPAEQRRFTPHLTLGRVKEGSFPRSALKLPVDPAGLEIGELALFESRTLPSGAVHEALSRFSFGQSRR